MYCYHLSLISSASVRTISVLYRAHLFMKCSLGVSNFLEEISSLSHSIVLLYFFALIAKEGFLISPCCSRNSAFKWVYLSFSPLCLASLLFSAILKASSGNHFPFWNSFSWGWSWSLPPVQCYKSVHSSSGTLSIRSKPLIYFSLPLYNHKGFDLGHAWMV